MSITVLADVFSKILAVYTLLLIVASVILNPLVLFICLKSKKLRSTTTFKLLACAAINDLLVCLAWDQESFTNTFFQLYPYFKSLFYCRWISVFLQFTTNEIESWMLVSISLDRFLSLSFKKWNTHFFNGLKPFIFASVLAFVIAAINFIEGFTSGFSYFDNGTEVVVCFVTPPEFSIDWYTIMEQLSVYFGYITPSAALIIINLAIIYKATKFDRAHKANQDTPNVIVEAQGARRKQEMTKTILIITFLYIVAAFPSNLVNGYFLLNVMNMEEGQLILNIVASVQFSYPAFNFFILFFSNKRFAHEVKELLTKFKNNSIGSSNNNNHVQTGSLHT